MQPQASGPVPTFAYPALFASADLILSPFCSAPNDWKLLLVAEVIKPHVGPPIEVMETITIDELASQPTEEPTAELSDVPISYEVVDVGQHTRT